MVDVAMAINVILIEAHFHKPTFLHFANVTMDPPQVSHDPT